MRLIVQIKNTTREYDLREGTSVIGRDPSCDICIPDPSLSRRHLACILSGSKLIARDLNSKNGTFLGRQHIEEVYVRPGVRLRAGNVWLRFEATRESESVMAVGTSDSLSPLEHLVPDDDKYHAEEEPTPVDTNLPASDGTVGEGSTRLVTRDGRWFVQDMTSGAEVEIVPRQLDKAKTFSGDESTRAPRKEGAVIPLRPSPTAKPVTAVATPRQNTKTTSRQRRLWRLVVVAVIFLMAVVALAVWMLPPKKTDLIMPIKTYRQRINATVEDIRRNELEKAEKALRELAEMRDVVQGRPFFAHTLLDAVRAEQLARANFAKAWETAYERWDDVRKSSENTDQARALTREKLDWYNRERLNLGALDDAKHAFEQGDYEDARKHASSISANSIFSAEGQPIVAHATDALVINARAKADMERRASNWLAAIPHLERVIEYKPAISPEVKPIIAEMQLRERERQLLESAGKKVAANNYAAAVDDLSRIPAESPYAADAQALRAEAIKSMVAQKAKTEYGAGHGENALKILGEANLGDTALYHEIQSVLAVRKRADSALKESRYAEAQTALEEIGRLGSDKNNSYATAALRELQDMPETIRATARALVEKGDEAVRNRNFIAARASFEEAFRFDPNNAAAPQGLAQLRQDAMLDYNIALQIKDQDPSRALQLLKDAQARVRSSDNVYRLAEAQIREIEAKHSPR